MVYYFFVNFGKVIYKSYFEIVLFFKMQIINVDKYYIFFVFDIVCF